MTRNAMMPEILHSAVPGRLRLKIPPILDRPARARNLVHHVLGLAGVTGATARSTTGSLIVTYDSTIATDDIRNQVSGILGLIDEPVPHVSASRTRYRRQGGNRQETAVRPPPRTAPDWHSRSAGDVVAP